MYYFKFIIAFHLLIGCYAADSNVAQAFLDNGIVPNIIDVAPEQFISVNYTTVAIDLGTRVNPTQTLTQPDIIYEASADKLYTFMFFGPDLPIDLIPRYTQFLHMLVVNVRGKDLTSGDAVSPYFPPVPYPGGFIYSFILFEQAEEIDPEPLRPLSEILNRPHFDPVGFKETYRLTGPIAGNFMREVYLPVNVSI